MNRILFRFLLLLLPIVSVAQIDINKAFDALKQAETANSIVESAVKPELSIIRQQYRLERNGEYFGRNHQPYYGESYSLAVKVPGGTLFLSDVTEPWKRDVDYARDNSSGNYKPSLFWTYQRFLDGTDCYNTVNLEIGDENGYVAPMTEEKNLYIHTDVISDFGLVIDRTSGNKEGYMLWAYASTPRDSTMEVTLKRVPFSIDSIPAEMKVIMDPVSPRDAIGGVFVTPKIERGGRVQFLLSGVAVRGDSDEWYLQFLSSGDRITRSDAAELTKKKEDKEAASKKK